MTDIPEWAKPLVAARERGATLQCREVGCEWDDEGPALVRAGGFSFNMPSYCYRVKPGTDHGERTADPLIFGASIPCNEPVPVVDEYVPLRNVEVWAFSNAYPATGANTQWEQVVRAAHRAGWERRRTP